MDKMSSGTADALMGGLSGLALGGGKKGMSPWADMLMGGALGAGLGGAFGGKGGGQSPLAAAVPSTPVQPQPTPQQPTPFSRGTPDAPWSNANALPPAARDTAAAAGKLDLTGGLDLGKGVTPPTAPTLAGALPGPLTHPGITPGGAPGGAGAASGAAQIGAASGALGKGAASALGKANPWIQGAEILHGLRQKKLAEETPQYHTGFST